MYVKLFNQILDSSIANNRKLRHFFTDLMLCSDMDGNVVMTMEAIGNRIRCPLDEVEWGIAELSKPDPSSFHSEHEGRRIIPLDGHGYGWKIVNYAMYRDFKTSKQMRDATAERVRRHRERVKLSKYRTKTSGGPREKLSVKAHGDGDTKEEDRMSNPNVPIPNTQP